ncbi:23S rRNA (adenine(2030)-N(6))-methyltransferase RlmJ [Chitinimonas sp. BJB300]|uniref:23S rRNA (adenine(2030)-N(6))-methyltransferase RlmJ n=1 Tax=Chitinimonas sp. BJB300 TaxID=1559339 RepID=UPI000C0EC27F|nr:23S rRNA (adenine(2030)-N(6))-methyltransferase RlmJ [Chitinimonas sp. BJB300]PHV12469.1 23S rRNA (adenine(2030)-N(6))-methyltransferase RlmJ [Chitinimonas sp. BJB300]TSJ89142.1 23S rRNA (adenine(2030)-N(6))-methyltransferase RlmJ [Chitinimonas sp. BJB300]
MLSYRHAFHAGNHADVLKHYVLAQMLGYLNQKDKPYWYIDTHAGAGCYQLDSGYAAKNAEYATGIARLWQRQDLPTGLADYVQLVRDLNPDGALKLYPGSPLVARNLLRPADKLRLFELHPTDFPLLEENMRNAGRQALVQKGDGFAGLKALLPPPPRRAVVLIDPPYEDKQDYPRVVTALEDALKRFPTGVYALWYPILQRQELRPMLSQLKALPTKSWLQVSLSVHRPRDDGFGMHGSGLFIVNPPWMLHDELNATLPLLCNTLALDDTASFQLEQLAD